MLYDKSAKKKPTNLSINSDLIKKAKEYDINLSSTLEKTLEEKIRQEKIKSWKEENKEFIEAYNKDIEENGVFSDGLRSF